MSDIAMSTPVEDAISEADIRSAVRELCAHFPGEYWRDLEPDGLPGRVRRGAHRGAAGSRR